MKRQVAKERMGMKKMGPTHTKDCTHIPGQSNQTIIPTTMPKEQHPFPPQRAYRKPSEKRVLALANTHALSTRLKNSSARCASLVTMHSVCPEPLAWMWSTASFRLSTSSMVRSMEEYSWWAEGAGGRDSRWDARSPPWMVTPGGWRCVAICLDTACNVCECVCVCVWWWWWCKLVTYCTDVRTYTHTHTDVHTHAGVHTRWRTHTLTYTHADVHIHADVHTPSFNSTPHLPTIHSTQSPPTCTRQQWAVCITSHTTTALRTSIAQRCLELEQPAILGESAVNEDLLHCIARCWVVHLRMGKVSTTVVGSSGFGVVNKVGALTPTAPSTTLNTYIHSFSHMSFLITHRFSHTAPNHASTFTHHPSHFSLQYPHLGVDAYAHSPLNITRLVHVYMADPIRVPQHRDLGVVLDVRHERVAPTGDDQIDDIMQRQELIHPLAGGDQRDEVAADGGGYLRKGVGDDGVQDGVAMGRLLAPLWWW